MKLKRKLFMQILVHQIVLDIIEPAKCNQITLSIIKYKNPDLNNLTCNKNHWKFKLFLISLKKYYLGSCELFE